MSISRYLKLRLNQFFQKKQEYNDFKHRDYYTKTHISPEAKYNKQIHVTDKQRSEIETQSLKTKKNYEIKIIPDSKSIIPNIVKKAKKKLIFNGHQIHPEHVGTYKCSDYIDRHVTQILTHEDNEIIHSNSNIQNNIQNYNIVQEDNIIKNHEKNIKYDLSSDEFNYDKFIKDFNKVMPKPLDKCTEDLSDFGPGLSPTFNFAAYADKSELIQTFVKLGVKLYKLEMNQDHMRALLTVDIKTELPEYLQFFHDCGVVADCLGDIITINPMILKEDLDDMKTRIRYLRAQNFTQESIARIITKNPTWLTWATKHIDERLGHFQNEFKLSGAEVRFLSTKQPQLITYNKKHIVENTFAVREEMGFNKDETKILLLAKPRIWINNRKKIVNSFNYLHNIMSLSHFTIVSNANILTCRSSRLKNRHEFLLELKRVQYDPKKPGYISPMQLGFGSDAEFCANVAKTSVEIYNLFLKTR